MTVAGAKQAIKDYFYTFWKLEEWINETQEFIAINGYVYSPFGRKRRLLNARSKDKKISSHEIRSGLNFIVQSVASDINLLAAIDMNAWIKINEFDAKIFALVHDSILAEVREDLVDEYILVLQKFVQQDRGVMISGCPVRCDFEVGDDYSMGKFEKYYATDIQEFSFN